MFHLFSGIQVVPDCLVFYLNREYVLSDFTDYQYDFNYNVVDQLLNTPHVTIARADNYDQLVGSGKRFATDLDFFQDIYAHKGEKPTVYASKDSLATIVCKFLKLLYPNITSDLAYTIYKLSIDKFIVCHIKLQNFVRGNNLISPENILKQGVKRLNKQQFVQLFESCEFTGPSQNQITDFREFILNEVSTEFQIANCLLDNHKFDQVLTRQLKNVAVDHVRSVCKEYSEIEYYNLLANKKQDCDILELMASDPVVVMYTNPVLTSNQKLDDFTQIVEPARKAISYYQSNINRYHWDLEKRVVDNWSGEYSDFMWLCEILDDQFNVDQILQRLLQVREHGYAGDLLYFYSSVDNINCLLLFYVYDLYKSKDETLQQFLL